MNQQHVSLIFDIGKTTKKALLFDMHFQVLEEQTEHFNEIPDEDGFPSEDLNAVAKWVIDIFNQFTKNPRYQVTHINFSAYGASFVHIDEKEEVIEPLFNYLKPLTTDCKNKFLTRYNADHQLLLQTASPFLGLLNSGVQLFWLKHERPALFRKIKTSLHFPQYFTFVLTGKKFCDITSLGCHTMLWDFHKQQYHSWVAQENLLHLFPAVQTADYSFDITLHNKPMRMGIGVHDSSAALMPYLVTADEPFLLLSTGTWNICFNPFNHEPLTREDLLKDCLCYLTFQGKPVKASRIFLGHEHEVQQKVLAKYFNIAEDQYKSVTFDELVYNHLVHQNDSGKNFYPMEMEGNGPIGEKSTMRTDYAAFDTFEEAQHQLIRYLVNWQMLSIDLVDPRKEIKNIIVVGGFARSAMFLEILKRQLPSRNILISHHPRASALGAAWLVNGKVVNNGDRDILGVYEA